MLTIWCAVIQSLQKGRRMAANPFFDAIRQNREVVDLETSIKNVQPLSLSPKIEKSAEHLPGFLRSLVDLPPKQRAERLAAEFHELETLEQRRLSELMEWHSAPQRHGVTPADNPLSISAGVEKGHLNRYKHIFPVGFNSPVLLVVPLLTFPVPPNSSSTAGAVCKITLMAKVITSTPVTFTSELSISSTLLLKALLPLPPTTFGSSFGKKTSLSSSCSLTFVKVGSKSATNTLRVAPMGL